MNIIKRNKNLKENVVKLFYKLINKLLYYKREYKALRLYISFALE